MLKSWKNLVVKWLNCFDVGSVENVHDIKTINFVRLLNLKLDQTDHEPFQCLLQVLQSYYPKFDPLLLDPHHANWSNENELYVLATLLLLHASIYHPSQTYQDNAGKTFDPAEQELVVTFLQDAMVHEKQLTRQLLLNAIPSAHAGTPSINPATLSLSPSPNLKTNGSRGGTPLADFLSSPVARQKRQTVSFKERLSQMEGEIEVEQHENEGLQHKAKKQELLIAELGKKLKDKVVEVNSLKECLQDVEESCHALRKEKGNVVDEKNKFRQELQSTEKYVKELEEEINSLKVCNSNLTQKLSSTQDRCSELESVYEASRSELRNLKLKLEQQSEEYFELTRKCSNLERDINQIQSTSMSPRKNWSTGENPSPIQSPSSGPENLGFILEKEMIHKDHENLQLKKDLDEMEDKWKNLKSAYSDLEQKAKREQEASCRSQRKLESKIENLQQQLLTNAQALSCCKKEKDEVSSQLSDSRREKEALNIQFHDVSTKNATLVSEINGLNKLKHALEVKVVQLEAKLNLAAETEMELQEISRKRTSELDVTKLERDDFEVKLRTSQKEKLMIEEQLREINKKLYHAQSVEIEKDELEEQVLALQESSVELEKKCRESNSVIETLEERLQHVIEDKKIIEAQLKDANLKTIDVSKSLSHLETEKNTIADANVDLQKDKVRLEAELNRALQQINDAREQLSREESEKKSSLSKLEEVLATNDELSSKLSILSQQESDLNSTLKEITKQKKSVDIQLSVVVKEKNLLEKDLLENSSQLLKSRQECETLSQILSGKEKELDEIKATISDLSDFKVAHENQQAKELEEKSRVQSELDEVKNMLKLAQLEVSNLQTALEVSEQLSNEKTMAYDDLSKEKADVEDDLCHYVSSLNATMQENSSLKSEVSLLKKEKEDLVIVTEDLSKLKSDLEEKLTSMESQLSSMQNDEAELLAKMKTVLNERDEKLLELEKVENNLAILNADLSNLKDSNSTLLQQLACKTSEVEALSEKLENWQDRLKSMQDDCDDKAQRLSILKEDLIEKQVFCETLQEDKMKLHHDIACKTEQNNALCEDVKKYLSQIETLSVNNDNLAKNLSKLQTEKDDILIWIETVENEKKNLIEQLGIVERNLEEYQQLAAQHKDSLLKVQGEHETLKKQNHDLQAVHEDLLKDTENEVASLQQQIQELHVQHEESLKNAEEEEKALRQQIQELRIQHEESLKLAEEEKKALRQQIQELRVQHEESLKLAEEEKEAFRQQIQELNVHNEESLKHAEEEKKALRQQIQELRVQHEESLKLTEEEKEAFRQQIQELNVHNEESLKHAEEENDALRQQIQELHVRNEESLKTTEEEKDAFKQQIQDLLVRNEESLKHTKEEKEALRQQIQELDMRNESLKTTEEEKDAFKHQIQDLLVRNKELLKNTEEEKEALRQQIQELDKRNEESLKSTEEEKDAFKQQIQDLLVRNEELLKHAKEEKEALKQQIQELLVRNEESLKQAEEEKEGLKQQIQELHVHDEISPTQMEVENEGLKQQIQDLCAQKDDLLKKVEEERKALVQQIHELHVQREDSVKEALPPQSVELQTFGALKEEVSLLKNLLDEKNEIIARNAALSSQEVMSPDVPNEVTSPNYVKQLEEDLQSSQSTAVQLAQELSQLKKKFDEERIKFENALQELKSEAKINHQTNDEQQQKVLTTSHIGGKLADVQREEAQWQLNRVKHQLEFGFDSIMRQKTELEDHLAQLRTVLDDVCRVSDNIFSTLPSNCNAVHEITVMKKEVETKLRAVDKKYADCLCSIITLAHEIFKCTKTQEESEIIESGPSTESLITSVKVEIENKVILLGEVMSSLTSDVRSVINSCKFLSERCESYLKAQTRESLKIKASFNKENTEGGGVGNISPNSESKDTEKNLNGWFGGALSLEEGYSLMRSSHLDLEKQVVDLCTLLKEPTNDPRLELPHIKEKIESLMNRPTQEDFDRQMKDLHVQYAQKFEVMKAKMKKIAQDEVEKVEDEKSKLEKEIVAKYNKRISDFEEHVKQLSAQLWELGEKLLQEQQNHKITKEHLVTMKERQRQYVMSKQHTQSLDRLDLLMQGEERNIHQPQRRCLSQSSHIGGISSTKVRSRVDVPSDVDECPSKQSTMMAPASMGLAFPEEDEDGEVFNNDYLAELKEGRCRAPLDGSRLSELQYRNSLCPPHLKSSYPLETQFVDPTMCKDEELKGHNNRARRQGKDHGSTSYKKPGPPTPSKKAGRLSLQGKEDLTPRVALRDHNESQASQGTGTLRGTKTTPSRLRALFTSSKVANAATLPSNKKDDNSTPATPTSKRLSIFKRRFGGNKENQNASSGYASFR